MPRKSKKQSTEAQVREIRRRTRRKFSAEEKIRIVLDVPHGSRVHHRRPPRCYHAPRAFRSPPVASGRVGVSARRLLACTQATGMTVLCVDVQGVESSAPE